MQSSEIRQKFLDFFEKRGHKIVPSSSLIPDDPSVLLTTAGMQQFKKYYTKELDAMRDFGSLNTTSIQKSFRTSDIDEVGDESHLTFFEMLGNFSFGGYFKREAIQYAYDFIVKEMGLKIDYVTVFSAEGGSASGGKGFVNVPKDEESIKIWNELGVKDVREEGMEDVFWGPTGSSGPCGPTTEIYVKNSAGQSIEIWNIVFNEFLCTGSREELISGKAELKKSKTPGIDTGMGLERLAMVSQNVSTIFETDLFAPIFIFLNKYLSKSRPEWSKRIIADHIRGIVFLIADGVRPSNKGTGYVLRRLMRRAMPHLLEFQLFDPVMVNDESDHIFKQRGLSLLANLIIEEYSKVEEYKNLINLKEEILRIISEENDRFDRVYEKGKKILDKIIIDTSYNKKRTISGSQIFDLVTTHGFSIEWIKDQAQRMHAMELELEVFKTLFKKHQEISRAGIEKKFGGHGLILDTGELKAGNQEELNRAIRLHTTTHLLQQALRDVLGDSVHQMGSDVTSERTRFDFGFNRKMTPEEIKKVENIINEKIKEDLMMQYKELPKEEALKTGALHFFKEKYPEKVKIYYLGREGGGIKDAYSKEFCGGPHVNRTSEIGKVKILKEEAVSAGVRRIRATID